MKSQVYTPEGIFRHLWTTPERYPHKKLWLWDSCYHSFGNCIISEDLAKDSILALLDSQLPDGMIPHMSAPDSHSRITQPPLIAWSVEKIVRRTGDADFAGQCYDALTRYLQWDMDNRRSENGLFFWHINRDQATNRCDESGMDNCSRFDNVEEMECIDFSCFMKREADAMRYLAYGPKSEQAEHHRYGPLCQMTEIDGEASLEFTCMGGKKFSHGGHFTQVTVLASGTGSLELFVGNDSIGDIREIESETMQMLNFPAGGYKGRLAITGHVEIYGLMLDGGRGVQMDNIGLRGSSGTLFTSIDRSTLTPFFSRENVRLIILQFGGNAVPYMDEQSDINGYVSGMRSQIRMFKRLAPQSCILFIGPSDMATQVGEEMVTYPILPNLISSLRKMCGEEGVAFWNMFAAQGGAGSMVRWCELGLAGEDYVHFSPSGARRISKLFFESLQKYYQFYRLRMGLDNMEEPSDSTENATGKDSVRKADEKIRSARRDSIKATMAKRDTTKTGKEMLP